MWPHTACGIETRKRYAFVHRSKKSHVTSYRLRYWNDNRRRAWTCAMRSHVTSYRLRYWNAEYTLRVQFFLLRHMWPHTACGIETRILANVKSSSSVRSHVTSYRLRYWNENYIECEHCGERSHVTSYRLRYWNHAGFWPRRFTLCQSHVTSYRLRYWNLNMEEGLFPSSKSHVTSYRLRYWNYLI